jgi:osmotically-inducible protein OsmY
MEYTRVEIELIRRGWLSGVPMGGAVAGPARGVTLDSSFTVRRTLVSRRRSRTLPSVGEDAVGQDGAAAGGQMFTRASRVRGATGNLGTVSRLWVSRATGKVTHVLVRASGSALGARPEYIVPANLLSVSSAALSTSIDAAQLRALPIYRPDGAIEADVRLALEEALADPRARRAVKVRVDDGQVYLAGVVDTSEQVRYAERAVRSVAGVRGLIMDVVAEESVAAAVEARIAPLAAAAANGHGEVRAFSEHGIVYLEGSVASPASRSEIERVAISVAGVRAVVNNLRVQGEPPGRGPGTGPLVRNR